MKFNRTNGVEELLGNLKEEELYVDKLKEDIEGGKIFIGLRNKAIDFYWGGSKIYSYESSVFSSHKKFCINAKSSSEYIKQNDLENISIVTCPIKNYELIKKNAEKYAGLEDKGISQLFNQDFFSKEDIFLLDIEISFSNEDKKSRIDLLLYDNKNKILKFIEAKDYSNKELWSKEDTQPKVVEQIKRYNEILQDSNKYETILKEYRKYIVILNESFDLSISEPKEIIKNTSLYMFGFDEKQKSRTTDILINDGSLENIPYYFIGKPSGVKISTIFNTNQNKNI